MANSSKNSNFESPLRYPGGKACIFPFISNLFFENDLIGTNYAEPYAGGAGLALKLLFNEYVDNIYINDLDRSIYFFWKVILEQNVKFCDWIENTKVDLETWHYYKSVQKELSLHNEFTIAQSLFFLNRTNVSGVIKGGAIGGLRQRGNYKIDVRFNKDDLINRIQRIQRFKHRIKISNYDGIKFIKRIEKLRDDVFIYLDPPYLQKGADLYMNFYSDTDHKKLAKHVEKLDNKWLVSYDNHDFIIQLYNQYKKVNYQLSQSASNRIGDEILIFSKKVNFKDSILKLSEPILI
ncbi:MAG: DNA adenine methylase [Ferruginibacter sp.]